MDHPKIVSFINYKGGCGKTNTAVNFSYYCGAAHNMKTLLIDWDPQGDATQYIGYGRANAKATMLELLNGSPFDQVVQQSSHPNLFLVPANAELKHVEDLFAKNEETYELFRDSISKLTEYYDIIIIDCPPANSTVNVASIYGSSSIFVVTTSVSDSIEKIHLVERMIENISSVMKSNLDPAEIPHVYLPALRGIIHSQAKLRTNEFAAADEYLKSKWGTLVINPPIPDTVQATASVNQMIPLLAFDPLAKISRRYKEVFEEVLSRASQ